MRSELKTANTVVNRPACLKPLRGNRWFLVGPKRSGTSVHIDPLGTSAWNTVVSGRKLWVVFPPHVDKNVAKGKDVIRQGEDDEPVRD